jgi:hypothetical protein
MPSMSSRTAWHQWVTLAMLALAFLTIGAVTAAQQPADMISLTRNEIAHLAAVMVFEPRHPAAHQTREPVSCMHRLASSPHALEQTNPPGPRP